jgi:Protein kinase domain/PEGA domain
VPRRGLQWTVVPPLFRLGKYVVDGLLGPGGVTETYLAHLADEAASPGTAAFVALKLLRPDRIADERLAEARKRFLAAAHTLRDFHRPGFGKVIDVSEDPLATFMVSEVAPGYDLARLVENHRFRQVDAAGAVVPLALVRLIGSQVAHLLHVGHGAKPMLCHLGLAPQNVMVSESGDVTLLDAGIACGLRGITEQPAERWAFVAPELQNVDVGVVVLDERHRIAADLYALGAVLHFLLTGDPPSSAGQPLRQDFDAALGDLSAPLRSLLSPEPYERPESAQRLLEWLAAADTEGDTKDRRERIAASLQFHHAPPHATAAVVAAAEPGAIILPSLPSTANPLRRRPLVLAAGIVFVLAFAGAGLLVLGHAPRTGNEAVVRDRTLEAVPSPSPKGQQVPSQLDEEPQGRPGTLSDRVRAGVAGHLVVETVPPGAMVFVDGDLKGQTFADIFVGQGSHRIVVIAPGHRMFREVVDTTAGMIIRRTLVPVLPPARGNGFVSVDCRSAGRIPVLPTFPIVIDNEETGLLCPAKLIPMPEGKHLVGIFVPAEDRSVFVETTVEIGSKAAVARFVQ